MPSFEGTLSSTDIKSLTMFVKSLNEEKSAKGGDAEKVK